MSTWWTNKTGSLCQISSCLILILASSSSVTAEGSLGIPGTTQTLSGYDTELGKDPICWKSNASATPAEGIAFPNVLVKDFALADKVELLPSCPDRTWLEAQPPPEFRQPGFRPRTREWYNFTVKGSFDVAEITGKFVASDEGSRIAISILACDTVKAGFCSPFVHEQASLREARELALTGVIPPKRKVGDRHGGTHVHSPKVVLNLPAEPMLTHEFEVQVPLIINDPGNFFIIGSLQFFTGETPQSPLYRYDLSNALTTDYRLSLYQEPPTILEVTRPVRIIAYVCVGLSSLVILALIWQTIKHYQSQVLQISQAPFLLVFLVAALIATVSSILLEPRNDLWCNLAHPFILIPLQLCYSITLGRLWRIHAVVSPLLRNRMQRGTTKKRFGCLDRLWKDTDRRKSPRQIVSPTAVIWIVLLCTLPQVILQITSWVVQPETKVVEYNEDQSIGRCVCDDGVDLKHSIRTYSLYTCLLLVLILLMMAHKSRQLPSLLNETAVIYDTTVVSIILVVLGMGVTAVTKGPETSPDVPFMVNVVLVLSITLNSVLRIMIPKLQLVWSGQLILVSQLVQDHRQSLIRNTSSKSSILHNVSGLEPSSAFLTGGSRHYTTSDADNKGSAIESPGLSRVSSDHDSTYQQHPDDGVSTSEQKKDGVEDRDLESSVAPLHSSQDVWVQAVVEEQPPVGEKSVVTKRSTRLTFAPSTNTGPKEHKIVVRQGEVPSKKLVLKLVDLKDELDHVTKRIMSGLAVEAEDWKTVRKRTGQLEHVFGMVEFEWDNEEKQATEP